MSPQPPGCAPLYLQSECLFALIAKRSAHSNSDSKVSTSQAKSMRILTTKAKNSGLRFEKSICELMR